MAKAVSPCAPSDALNALAAHLEERGLTRLYAASSGHVGVLSVEAGVTVNIQVPELPVRSGM